MSTVRTTHIYLMARSTMIFRFRIDRRFFMDCSLSIFSSSILFSLASSSSSSKSMDILTKSFLSLSWEAIPFLFVSTKISSCFPFSSTSIPSSSKPSLLLDLMGRFKELGSRKDFVDNWRVESDLLNQQELTIDTNKCNCVKSENLTSFFLLFLDGFIFPMISSLLFMASILSLGVGTVSAATC